jgi:phosphatidylglycerophosphatase A
MKKVIIDKIIGFSLLLCFLSPIIWIWFGWYYAWRIGLTGLFLFFILIIIKTALKQYVEQKQQSSNSDSNFQSKI